MATKIVIEVSGGVVQEVYCDDPTVSVTLIDWDNDDSGKPVPLSTTPLDQMDDNREPD